MSDKVIGDKCSICGFEVKENHHFGTECSEFCQVNDVEAFKALKPGVFGYFPCAYCGHTIWDSYTPGSFCGNDFCLLLRAKDTQTKVYDLLRKAQEVQSELGDSTTAFTLMDEAVSLLEESMK